MENFHDLSATTLEGAPYSFDQLKGKRVLIVNTLRAAVSHLSTRTLNS